MPSNLHLTVTIHFNGQPLAINQGLSISDLLCQQGMNNNSRFVVVLNDEIISRSNYSKMVLNNNDTVDVIAPISGG